ncbi:MAG: NACHT domain-containing protein [Cyanobacteriota bacterium]|nr:NACHT domain-containing protein [Cyanobacteriota bacterium]
MNSQIIFDNYIEAFCKYFKSEVEQDCFEGTQKNLTFFPFLRTFYETQSEVSSSNTENTTTTLEEIFKRRRQRLLLLGEPGAGKTVLLRHFAKVKGEEKQKNKSESIPIFASIRTWCGNKTHENKEQKSIIDWLANQVKAINPQLNKDFLKQQIRSNKVIFILDGLDELPDDVEEFQDPNAEPLDYRVEFLKKLREFQDEYQDNQIIITCRTQDYEDIIKKYEIEKGLNLNRVDLKELSYGEIKKYLHEVISQKSLADELWKMISKNLALLKMIRRPFLLSVVSFTYIDRKIDSENRTEQLIQISSSDQLFDNFVKQFYEREKRKPEFRVTFQLEDFKKILGQVATLMMSDNRPDDNVIFPDIFKRVIPKNEKREQLIKLSRNLALLIPASRENEGAYRFRHLLLRDYFAFQYIYQRLQESRETIEQLQYKENLPTKVELVVALGELNRPETTDLLIDILKSNLYREVCYEAVSSLGKLNSGIYFRGYDQDFSEKTLYSRSVTEFNKENIREYFNDFVKERPIKDSALERISRESLGIPFIVNLMAKMWAKGCSIEQIFSPTPKLEKNWQTPYEEVMAQTVNRFLIHCVNSSPDEEAIYLLAMMRSPDQEFLQKMLNVQDVRSRLEELYQRYSFILPEQQRLDEIYANFLKKDLRASDEREKKAKVEKIGIQAVLFFQDRLDRLKKKSTTAGQRIQDSEVTETISNLLYYKFWIDSKQAWNDLIPYLVEGWYYKPEWSVSLLQIVKPFTFTRSGRQRLELLTKGLLPSASTKAEFDLLKELEPIVTHTLENSEWIGLFLLKQADLLCKQERFQDVIEKCGSAKDCIPEEAGDLKRKLDGLLYRAETLYGKKEDIKDKERLDITEKSEEKIQEKHRSPSDTLEEKLESIDRKLSQKGGKASPPRQNNELFVLLVFAGLIVIGFGFTIVLLMSLRSENSRVGRGSNRNPTQFTQKNQSNNEDSLYKSAIDDARSGDVPIALAKFCKIPEDSDYLEPANTWIARWRRQDDWSDTVEEYLKDNPSCPASKAK